MTEVTDEERQLILNMIGGRLSELSGRRALTEYSALVKLRHKLEGVDKRIIVETVR